MNDAADELERMAEEFRKRRDSHNESAEKLRREPDGLRWQEQHEVVADAWGAAAAQLRARAAELRQQRTGTTYVPQPKPDSPWLGQWWSLDSATPRRVASIDGRDGMHFVCFEGDPFTSPGDVLMQRLEVLSTDPRWTYLGDGPEPARR